MPCPFHLEDHPLPILRMREMAAGSQSVCVCVGVERTLSTNVLSFSGISRGMVVRTSRMADRGILTLGLDAWGGHRKGLVRV